MPSIINALTAAQNALEEAADSISAAANELANSPHPDSAPLAGVYGIESSDTPTIEAVLQIARIVGQKVSIDYETGLGRKTYDRHITPLSIDGGSVVATDDYREGGTRRFFVGRIQKVRT